MQQKRYFADSSLVQFHIVEETWSKWEPKGLGKRGHIVAETLLAMMFLGLRKLGNICCGHKMFLNKIRNILCPGHPRGQTGKHLCRQQCVRKKRVLVCLGLKAWVARAYKQGAEKNGFFSSPCYKFQWNLSRCVESNAKSNKRFISTMAVLRLLWTTWHTFQLSSAKQNTIWNGLWNCLKKMPVQNLS